MKRPVFNYYQRHSPGIEVEIFKLKFKRFFETTWLYRFSEKSVDWLANKLKRFGYE